MMGQEQFQIGVPKALEIAGRLRALLTLYDGKPGMPIGEVDLYLLGTGDVQKTQIHTFAVGDTYKLLPEDEDPEIPIDGWKVDDIRAHLEPE